jgi:hypothetical protein
MATSVYFNNYNSKAEQRVIEDIIVESIKIMGFDGYYLPNDNDEARDLLYGEDPIKKFNSAFPVELYLSDVMDYRGEGEFFSKFGLEIKNNINVILSKRAFAQRVPQNSFQEPRDGDLIYVPVLNGEGELYEIKFVEQSKDMSMMGRKVPFFYELVLEKFKYSHEVIDTGISDIDEIVTDSSYSINLMMGEGTGNYTLKEIVYQSSDGTEANAATIAIVSSWEPATGTLRVTNIKGVFNSNQEIVGSTSNVSYTLTDYDTLGTKPKYETYDNSLIRNNANSIIDFSETNPFGNI